MRNIKTDVAVIGAGILGCTMARVLSRYKLDVCVVEAKADVGTGATKANSGIIQAGFQPKGGSLKGVSCVKGNAAYIGIAKELNVPFQNIGGLYVAFGPNGMEKIREKHERALQNGIGDLAVISGDEARELEPRLSSRAIAALVAPTTSIISPFELALATARNAASNGARFEFDFEVTKIERYGEGWRLHSTAGDVLEAKFVANMSGEEAAILDAEVHPADIVVRPRRGQFVVFDKQSVVQSTTGAKPITRALYQAQETNEGGVLITPTVEGNLLAGPTSENVRNFGQNATTEEGIEHVISVAKKLVPDLDTSTVITEFSGIRANIVNVVKEKKDFVVRASAPHFVSALGIKNPGMTSAPALVDVALSILQKEGLSCEPDPSYNPTSQGELHRKPFMQCSPEEQERMLAQDPRFGHVICRCEKITEGDVRNCMHELLPPHTFDGVKRRLRCSMGRCQGAFCTPRVMAIMADELGCTPQEISKGERGGKIVRRCLK